MGTHVMALSFEKTVSDSRKCNNRNLKSSTTEIARGLFRFETVMCGSVHGCMVRKASRRRFRVDRRRDIASRFRACRVVDRARACRDGAHR